MAIFPDNDGVVAIHQPNFFPWLGYFDKIVRSDTFIFMNNVQFQKTGGTWSNRVKLEISGEAQWVTAPVVRSFHGVRPISEIEFNENSPWREKLLKTLHTHYGKSAYFEQVFPILKPLVLNPIIRLSEYNIAAVTAICRWLEIDVGKLRKGTDFAAQDQGTDLLISMTRTAGGHAYLCGGGAQGYQDDQKFAASDIELIYQNFQHPTYVQSPRHGFIPGLSIIDALMHCGIKETSKLLGVEASGR